MGRLRHDEDFGYISRASEEVVDLFGTLAILYRFSSADNITTRDPLYDEPRGSPTESPGHTVRYKAYTVKCHFFDYNDAPFVSEGGLYHENTANGYVCLPHLIEAGIEPDSLGDYVTEGDVIVIHPRSGAGRLVFDIIQTTKIGWVNTSDKFTGYNMQLKKSTKYIPERKEDVI